MGAGAAGLAQDEKILVTLVDLPIRDLDALRPSGDPPGGKRASANAAAIRLRRLRHEYRRQRETEHPFAHHGWNPTLFHSFADSSSLPLATTRETLRRSPIFSSGVPPTRIGSAPCRLPPCPNPHRGAWHAPAQWWRTESPPAASVPIARRSRSRGAGHTPPGPCRCPRRWGFRPCAARRSSTVSRTCARETVRCQRSSRATETCSRRCKALWRSRARRTRC